MKVVLSTIGKFHTFDLARELHQHGHLQAIFTGYPRFKLQHEDLPQSLIRTFPWLHTPYMALPMRRWLGASLTSGWEHIDHVLLGRHVAAHLPECDVFMGLSGSGLEAGRIAKGRGAKYICDRGSTHIRYQNQILLEEYDLCGMKYHEINPRAIEREEAEYELSDMITVPSSFNIGSFLDFGIEKERISRVPYGVNLNKFHPTQKPAKEGFDVIFVGGVNARKGVHYLVKAFRKIVHKSKKLTIIGSHDENYIRWLQKNKMLDSNIILKGHVPQAQLKDIMSSSHVLVLPSIEEGLALVQAQALACACPVIASRNTGAEDLFEDGDAGFIVPIRDVDALADRMQRLADDPDLQQRMSASALNVVKRIGGWDQYGKAMTRLMQGMASSA